MLQFLGSEKKIRKLKQRVDFEECKDVVHSVPCMKCDLRYLGETGQHFCERMKQHERDVRNKKSTSGIYDHLRNNEGHSVNWAKLKYLDKENNWKGRKIKEAIYINALNPSSKMDPKKVMNLEKGFELDPIWSEFNAEFRGLMRKKFEK